MDWQITTWVNARFTAVLLEQFGIQPILWVISALHMLRDISHFETAGLLIMPAATDYAASALPGLLGWLPDDGALETTARGPKEVVGLWAVR